MLVHRDAFLSVIDRRTGLSPRSLPQPLASPHHLHKHPSIQNTYTNATANHIRAICSKSPAQRQAFLPTRNDGPQHSSNPNDTHTSHGGPATPSKGTPSCPSRSTYVASRSRRLYADNPHVKVPSDALPSPNASLREPELQ